METKEPVVLVVLVETAKLRWFVAGIDLKGNDIPLLRSEEGNLSPYLEAEGEEQVAFLRHRFSGVLQRGSDRLWGQKRKPCLIAFILDDMFIQAPPELTQRVAEHMVQWLWNPPVVFFNWKGGFTANEMKNLVRLAGDENTSLDEILASGLPKLSEAMHHLDGWELAAGKSSA